MRLAHWRRHWPQLLRGWQWVWQVLVDLVKMRMLTHNIRHVQTYVDPGQEYLDTQQFICTTVSLCSGHKVKYGRIGYVYFIGSLKATAMWLQFESHSHNNQENSEHFYTL